MAKQLNSWLLGVTQSIWQKRGLVNARLFLDWAVIVGPTIAAHSWPEKVSQRDDPSGQNQHTLTLRVSPGIAVEIQHMEPVLIERINSYFGYAAIHKITLKQSTPRNMNIQKPLSPVPQYLQDEVAEAVHSATQEIHNPLLREALDRFGIALQLRTRLKG